MRLLYLLPILGFLLLCNRDLSAQSNQVLLHLNDLNEKNIDSLSVWLAPEKNIIDAGICASNKLLILNLKTKDATHIQEVFSLLKKHNLSEFYLKENAPVDQLIRDCDNYISLY